MLMQNQNCGCSNSSREQLLKQIDEVSFTLYDLLLFLDTHPCDEDAMACYRRHVGTRKQLLKEFAEKFGPLTPDTADLSEESKWQWVMQPWPWEKGGSR